MAGGFLVYPGVREEVRQMASAGAGSAGVEVARGGVMNSPRYAGNGRRAGRLAALGAGVVVRKKAASAGAGWGGLAAIRGLGSVLVLPCLLVVGVAGGGAGFRGCWLQSAVLALCIHCRVLSVRVGGFSSPYPRGKRKGRRAQQVVGGLAALRVQASAAGGGGRRFTPG